MAHLNRSQRAALSLVLWSAVAVVVAGCGGAVQATPNMDARYHSVVAAPHTSPSGTAIVDTGRPPGPTIVITADAPYFVAGHTRVGHRRLDIGGRIELGADVWPGPAIATSSEEAGALTWFSAGCSRGGYLVVFGRVRDQKDVAVARRAGGVRRLSTASVPPSLRSRGVVVYGVLPYGATELRARDPRGRPILNRTVSLPASCVETSGNVRAA
jgi:hypothetical protein